MVDNPLAPLYGSDLAVNLAEIAVLNFGMLDRTGRTALAVAWLARSP
jgi:hypothetical protein